MLLILCIILWETAGKLTWDFPYVTWWKCTTESWFERWVSLFLLLCFLHLSSPLLCLFLLMCHHSQEIPHVLNGSKTFLLHEPVPFPLCLFLLIFLLLFFFTQVGLPTSFSFTQQSPSNICSFLHFFKTFPSTCLSLRAKSADSPSLKI